MPKFEVTVSNNQSYSAVIEVEADNEDEAAKEAEKIAEADSKKLTPQINWTLEENDFTVDDVDELDEEE